MGRVYDINIVVNKGEVVHQLEAHMACGCNGIPIGEDEF